MSEQSIPKQNKVVLVVDDDLDAGVLLEKFLTNAGNKVLLGSSGKEGLELFERESPDVIILDIALGDMSGIDVAKEMRKKKGNSLNIIGISAYSYDILEKNNPESIKLFTHFCFKPFKHKELIELIK